MLNFTSFKTFSNQIKETIKTTNPSIEEVKSAGTQLVKNAKFDNEEIAGWAKFDGAYHKISNACKELEPGFYIATLTMSGPCFIKFTISQDQILELPDSKTEEIINRGTEFWSLKETFSELNFLHKRGILLDGQVGTGKSVIAFKLGKNLIEKHGGVVIYPTSPYALKYCVSDLREVQPNTKIMVVLEDLDEICASYGEKMITAFLDGEFQVNSILTVATTNNIKGLSSRLTARPSRFDVKETISVLSREARVGFLKQKATTLTEEQIQNWADKTEDFTVPALKELMILVLAYCYPLDESIDKIRKNFVSKMPDF